MSFPRYEKYKDSGVEWLGAVPEHWDVKPLRRLVTATNAGEVIDRSYWGGSTELLYTCAIDPLDCDFEGFPGWKRASVNDLLLTRNGTPYVHKPVPGAIYTNVVQRVTLAADLDRNFMAVAVQNSADNLRGYGVSIESLNYEMWKAIPVVVPLAVEQCVIATFLDHETAKIDALVEEQKRLIELLKEKRQAVISHAVTKGLNPNAPMKDSGVEWLGEVPAHWEVRAIKHIVSTPITDGPHETPNFPDEGVPFVSAEAVSGGYVNFDKIRGFISEQDHLRYSEKYQPKRGDIFMVKSGATTGVTAIVETDLEFSIWSPLAVIRCGPSSNPYFVLHFLRCKNFLEAVTLNWSFGTQQNIGMGVIENLAVTVPPIDEQRLIAEFLVRESSKVDALAAEANSAMTLLQERRTALISAAVTGKIDVRGLAPVPQSSIEAVACAME